MDVDALPPRETRQARTGGTRGQAAPARTDAVVLRGDGQAQLEPVKLTAMGAGEVLVRARWSGISTGTERMFWSGEMPPFPGFSYPLVPGYETVGEIVAAPDCPEMEGAAVFVPGARCFDGAAGLFGASAAMLIVARERLVVLEGPGTASDTLLALAATAHHAIVRGGLPELIIGHGVLGRLAARITLALGAAAPTVWEINPARRDAAEYPVFDPATDSRRDYRTIMDLSGDAGVIDQAVGHAGKGAAITLAGFYKDRPGFAFPPAFMREISLHVAAEWTPDSMTAVLGLVRSGALCLDGLITHTAAPHGADAAYRTAFEDAACLKLVLDWGATS